MNTHRLGDEGEDFTCEYITRMGMKILARNYRFGKEEIDIIARDGKTCVFIEVKARNADLHGMPAEAVTPYKQRAIARTALAYLKTHALLDCSVRFDVAAIYQGKMDYIKNAFDTTGILRW